MLITYVNKKSELSTIKRRMELKGYRGYRTPINCGCKNAGNRRDGLLLLKGGVLKYTVMRCKSCARREADNANS